MQKSPFALLRSAGWDADRRVNPTNALAFASSRGIEIGVGSYLERTVSNLDGIVVRFTRHGRPDTIIFNVGRALSEIFEEWMDEYARRAQTPLLPFGFSNHEHLILLASDDGRWFGGNDDVFGCLGVSVTEVIDRITNNRGFVEEGDTDHTATELLSARPDNADAQMTLFGPNNDE